MYHTRRAAYGYLFQLSRLNRQIIKQPRPTTEQHVRQVDVQFIDQAGVYKLLGCVGAITYGHIKIALNN
jgi:hypothetical protein